MATFTASAADSVTPAHFKVNGVVARNVRFTQTAAFSVGDVIQMVKVPNGSTIVGYQLGSSLSAGVLTVNIGDGNDTSAIAANAVLSAGAAVTVSLLNNRGIGRSYSAEDTVDIQISALSAVPGTAKIFLVVQYYNGNS